MPTFQPASFTGKAEDGNNYSGWRCTPRDENKCECATPRAVTDSKIRFGDFRTIQRGYAAKYQIQSEVHIFAD